MHFGFSASDTHHITQKQYTQARTHTYTTRKQSISVQFAIPNQPDERVVHRVERWETQPHAVKKEIILRD